MFSGRNDEDHLQKFRFSDGSQSFRSLGLAMEVNLLGDTDREWMTPLNRSAKTSHTNDVTEI